MISCLKMEKEELKSIMITKKTPLSYIKKLKIGCEKCGHCCSFDSGIFLESDIKRIADKKGVPVDDFKKRFLEEKQILNKNVHKAKLKKEGKPFGKCVFLQNKECSIHDVKPLHCEIGSGCHEYGQQINIWFMLNHVLDESDPQAIRDWSVYLQSRSTIPGGELHELIKNKEKLAQILSYDLLR